MVARLLLSVIALMCCVLYGQAALHAHCAVLWTFDSSKCADNFDFVVGNIKNFSIPEVREGNYTLVSADPNAMVITALHTTPTHGYVDDLTFSLKQDGANCQLSGASQSRPVSLYDYDTNFCNLWNVAVRTNTNKVGTEKFGSCPFHPSDDFDARVKQCNQY
jgi:hypothetical protein